MADDLCLDGDETVRPPQMDYNNTQVMKIEVALTGAASNAANDLIISEEECDNRSKQRVETQKTDQMSSMGAVGPNGPAGAPLAAVSPNVGDTKSVKKSCAASVGDCIDGNKKCAVTGDACNSSNNYNNKQKQQNIGLRTVSGPSAAAAAGVPIIVSPGKSLPIAPMGAHLKPPLIRSAKEEEDIRKKRRCADRYDSSESSDSGVATLSCTDSSTASSDASDPGSPYSPSSCDDNNQTNGSSQSQRLIPHQWPWNTNSNTTTVSLANISNNSNINNNNTTTTNNNNNNKRTLSTDTTVTIKKVRSNSDKTIALSTAKKPIAITRHKSIDDNVSLEAQTKITGFFKSQIKPLNGIKRDLTNMVVRSKDFPKLDNIKKSCDYDVRTLTGISQPVKKVERKTAKVAPLVPISRKASSSTVKKPVYSSSKKPVNIAPRAIEPKLPKLQEIRQKPLDQTKLSQPAVLLTAIRIPQQQQHVVAQAQQQQQQLQAVAHQSQQPKTPTKMGSMFQLHQPVMPKLVQIPNILTKDAANLVVNNGHITRVNNGPHYFLNGAVIKLQPMSDPGTTTVDNSMLLKSQTLAAAVPFTSKSLPLHTTSLHQAQSQQQIHHTFATTNPPQYAQPVFMATSSGLLLSTALPTVITSQLSGLQTINQQTAISTLHHHHHHHHNHHQYNQQTTASVLPSISTLLHQHHTASQHTSNTFVSSPSGFHLQNSTHLNQLPVSVSNIPPAPPPIPPSKIPQPSFVSTPGSSTQQYSINSLPPLLVTSTPTTSITKSCISPIETSPIHLPFEVKMEIPELTQISLNVETALPTVPICPQQHKEKNVEENVDLFSPAVPMLSPKSEPIESLPSPKSLILEKIQQNKLDGLEDDDSILLKKSFDLLKVPTVDTEFQTASLPECAKSPILSQPKTIRFPAINSNNGSRNGNRRSDGRIIGVCYWDNCTAKYDTSSKLLDHLQTQHANTQTGPFMCQWSGCKVHGRESCSRRWLERHVLSHGGTKPFKCIVDGCGLRFGSQLALQKHVNSHFNTTDVKDQTTKRSSDPPLPKKLRVNGKKLRYRRQPFSARIFDYFDGGAMEVLQHRLAHTATAASGPGGSINFVGRQMAKRVTTSGTIEVLLKWHPCNIISDEWMPQSNVSLSKTIKVQSLSSIERLSLHRYLKHSYKNSNLISSASELAVVSTDAAHIQPIKHNRKPPKTQPS